MAKRTGGQRRTRPISKRGKGENRVTMARSRAKSKASGYKDPKKRTGPNTAAKKTIDGYKAGKGVKKVSRFARIKTAAKQRALNLKGKSKKTVRDVKAGKYVMTAAHRKAISDGLKKSRGNASSRISKFFGRKKK
jgi:hypothetical protein